MEKINLRLPRNSRSRHEEQCARDSARKVAYYIRCSTEEQAENPDGTIKNQEERLALALKLKQQTGGFTGSLAGVYADVGRSGKDMNRPELRRLLKDIERGDVNLVMVTELSRLSRSIKDFSEIWEFMQAQGCAFLSLRENFDTSNAAGEMMLYSLANFAQFERRQTSERVSANFEARAKRGLWNGGVLPLGYAPDPENRGSLMIVEEEARVVRAAFQALIDQGSVSQAARWLNQNGFHYSFGMRAGGGQGRLSHFIFDSLYRLLSNPAYIAVRRFKTKAGWQEGVAVWKPIIDLNKFEEAQKILCAGKLQKTGRESRYPYLLATRIFCGECGRILIGKSANGNSGKVPYYSHGVQEKHEQTSVTRSRHCEPFRIGSKKIEDRVWKEVLGIIEGTHRKQLLDAIRGLEQGRDSKDDLHQKENEVSAIRSKIANLAHRITELPQGVPADAFYSEMKNLSEQNTRLHSEMSAIKQTNHAREIVTETQLERLFTRLKSALPDSTEIPPDTKRRIVHALVHKVVVTKAGFEMHLFAGSDQIKTGEVLASPVKSLSKKNSYLGSFKNLNGGLGRNRTADTSLFRALLYRLRYQAE